MLTLEGTDNADTFDVGIYNNEKIAILGKLGNDLVGANGVTSMRGWLIDLGGGDDTVDFAQGAVKLDGTGFMIGVETLDTWNTRFIGTGGDNLFDFRTFRTTAFGSNWSVNVQSKKGDDTIHGSVVGDVLDGGAGDDVIAGEGGADTITGGRGADIVLWSRLDGARDVLTDFTSGVDALHIARTAIGNALPTGALGTGDFAVNAPTSGTAQFVYRSSDGVLLFDADGTGAQVATVIVALSAPPAAGDIVIV